MEKTKLVQKPPWLKSELLSGSASASVAGKVRSGGLKTVCSEAMCPNKAKCWAKGTATFMVMGSTCTRNCGFCSVASGGKGETLDAGEPEKVAFAAKEMDLKYVVLTSVDRDDLPDFGAGHFAACIKAVKAKGIKVEALVPDFQGRVELLRKIVEAGPVVLGHNLETVERLQGKVRDARAGYGKSLQLLHNSKVLNPKMLTKSSLMLGLGEKEGEVLYAMDDLRAVNCDFLTIGQYLQPTKKNILVEEYIRPEQFRKLKKEAIARGFLGVKSGPLVRTSYMAGDLFGGSNL